MRTGKYCTNSKEIPSGEHWAIIRNTSTHHEADERSKTCPGHGYPEYTEYNVTYQAFTDEEEFKSELTREIESHRKYGGYGSMPLGIHVSGVITVDPKITLMERK